MSEQAPAVFGPQYQSGRPRIVHYSNDEATLYLHVEMPDGSRYTDTLVLPDATPMPDEHQLVGYGVVGRTAYAYEHLRYFVFDVLRNGERYFIGYDADDLNKLQWFVLPFLRPLHSYEIENLKKWGYTE